MNQCLTSVTTVGLAIHLV